ncbi:MAG: hypothetical protein [Olavius algarvensis spirochete endosymbiont]|nr:MAG: hypothetical protein [Olavius algarvensis spirochete endosymbiont]
MRRQVKNQTAGAQVCPESTSVSRFWTDRKKHKLIFLRQFRVGNCLLLSIAIKKY